MNNFDNLQKMISHMIEKDMEEKRKKSIELANKNDPVGLYELRLRHKYGWDVEMDSKKSYDLIKNAVEQGHTNACYEIAKIYIDGGYVGKEYIKKNLDEAKKYVNMGSKDFIYNKKKDIDNLLLLNKVIMAYKSRFQIYIDIYNLSVTMYIHFFDF